jgi:hypothetical protein
MFLFMPMLREAHRSEAAEYERGAERLFEAVTAAGASQAGLGEQVRSSLDAALALLASDPALARLLTLRPFIGDQALLESHRSWVGRYADQLRRAARSSPGAIINPPFVEPAILGGVRFQIAKSVLAGQAERLPELAPEMARFLLCYYLPSQQATRFAA